MSSPFIPLQRAGLLHSARKSGWVTKELTPGPSLGNRGEKKREESRGLLPREPPSLAKRRGLPAWLADRGGMSSKECNSPASKGGQGDVMIARLFKLHK